MSHDDKSVRETFATFEIMWPGLSHNPYTCTASYTVIATLAIVPAYSIVIVGVFQYSQMYLRYYDGLELTCGCDHGCIIPPPVRWPGSRHLFANSELRRHIIACWKIRIVSLSTFAHSIDQWEKNVTGCIQTGGCSSSFGLLLLDMFGTENRAI